MARGDDLWCDYCTGPCGVGVYTLKVQEGGREATKTFCDKDCRDLYKASFPGYGEEPNVVY